MEVKLYTIWAKINSAGYSAELLESILNYMS